MKSIQLAVKPRIDAFSARTHSLEDISTTTHFGEYVVFVDESGDANLDPIDPRFPMLNLVFCIIRKDHYFDHVTPKLKQLKEAIFWTSRLNPSRIRYAKENWRFFNPSRCRHTQTLDGPTSEMD